MTIQTIDDSPKVILHRLDAILNELLALREAVQKMAQTDLQSEPVPPYMPVKLAGLWQDAPINEDDIDEARRRMWARL